MATTLTTKLDVNLSWRFIDTDATSSRQVIDSNSVSIVDNLANGVAVDTANIIWDDRRTVLSGADDDLDLAGVLTTRFGATVTFVKVKGIFIRNRTTTAAHILTVGAHATAAFYSFLGSDTDVIKIGPDGAFLLWNPSLAGYAVTATTADILRLTAGGGDITYDIAIIGTTS